MAPPRRVSFKQIGILAEFAETHQHIALGRYGTVQGLKEARKAWETVAVRLNAVGIKRTPDQWRRYWIEYKAKLKSKAADSRRFSGTGSGGRLRPLTDREQQLLELINRGSAEGANPNVTEIQYSPIHQTSSPESQIPSLEAEWLDYDSESDDQEAEENERSQSEETPDDSEMYSPETEDEIEGTVRERWKNEGSYIGQCFVEGGNSSKKIKQNLSQSNKKRRQRYNVMRKEQKNYRFTETDVIQNNIVNTSSPLDTADQDEIAKKASIKKVAATALEYFHSKKRKFAEGQDPDLLFFHSILPEMKQMTPDQKRQFKMGVWSLASQILEPNTDSPPDHQKSF